MWNDITVDVINVECDPEESNQGGIEPAPKIAVFVSNRPVLHCVLGLRRPPPLRP